jgi:ferredoxin
MREISTIIRTKSGKPHSGKDTLMKLGGRRVLICNCGQTMALDGKALATALAAEEPFVHTQLCRQHIDNYKAALTGGEPVLVACTQEAPLFSEVAHETASDTTVAFTNIRERAGWSADGPRATPKIAALLAEAAIPIEPTPAITLKSEGAVLVYGEGETALAAARQLAGRLAVTLLMKDAGDILPPPVMDVAITSGRIRRASGHLGAFEIGIDNYAVCVPSSRAALRFQPTGENITARFDLILDMSGDAPLFPAPDRRDGYVRVEPSDPVRLQRALFDLVGMVGEFEKPRFLKIDPALCAHSRNGIVGCTLCLDVCPTSAIVPMGDHTEVDPHVCDGHGACASACPTGAIVFDVPCGDALFDRLRAVATTYRQAGGEDLVLLLHGPGYAEEMISIIARVGRGLPAHVVPFAVREVTQIGLDFLLTAFTYGVQQIWLLAGPERARDLGTIRQHLDVVEALFAGLGYESGRVVIDVAPDPTGFQDALYATRPPAAMPVLTRYRAVGGKRMIEWSAIDHIRAQAPAPVEFLAMPQDAPFGQVLLDQERCTLCLSCVGACPTQALGDDPDRPRLTFRESACVQCGLCRNTCPEDAITLSPRLSFADAAKNRVVLQEEEPFCCIRCGKPFASPSVINRLTARLSSHGMFAAQGRLDLIKMCQDCRVMAQFEDQNAPFRVGRPPVPRTTDDYLRERAAQQALVPGTEPDVSGGNGARSATELTPHRAGGKPHG